MLPAVVVDGYGTIGPSAFSGIDVGGAAVLLLTGWTCTGAPTDTATQPIRTEYGVLVGIDSVNIDDTRLSRVSWKLRWRSPARYLPCGRCWATAKSTQDRGPL